MGRGGSGCVFFSRCTMKCLYCQNSPWSWKGAGADKTIGELTRIFRDRTGMTPQEFAAEERMQFAVRLLRDSFQSCEEIAEQTGYSSAVSFNRAFRRRFGYSPMQYRKSKMRNLPRNEDP